MLVPPEGGGTPVASFKEAKEAFLEEAKELNTNFQGHILSTGVVLGKRFSLGQMQKPRKRGVIFGFSRGSRIRLMRKLHIIDYEKMGVPLFLTLTYPGHWEKDFQVWKDHFDRFCIELDIWEPDSCLIWKIEPQQRGAPHFHCLVFGAKRLDTQEGRDWVSKTWYRIVGSGDDRHLRAGTRVEHCKSVKFLLRYLVKYIGKAAAYDLRFGRIWGLRGRRKLEYTPITTFKLTKDQFLCLRRLIRKYLESRRRFLGGKKFRPEGRNRLSNVSPLGNWAIVSPEVQQRLVRFFHLESFDSS